MIIPKVKMLDILSLDFIMFVLFPNKSRLFKMGFIKNLTHHRTFLLKLVWHV